MTSFAFSIIEKQRVRLSIFSSIRLNCETRCGRELLSKRSHSSYICIVSVIGIYDSGIGGLTTLNEIRKAFGTNDFFYYSDNLNHPFGVKTNDELKEIVSQAIEKMKQRCDVIVLACNTASSVYEKDDVIKLLPPLEDVDKGSSLLMATQSTINNVDARFVATADTKELASLIEIQAFLNQKRGSLNMDALSIYLKTKLFRFKGVKTVILGCSHYPYCKSQIEKILGNVTFIDGNRGVIKALKKQNLDGVGNGNITFEFNGENREKEYRKILSLYSSQN